MNTVLRMERCMKMLSSIAALPALMKPAHIAARLDIRVVHELETGVDVAATRHSWARGCIFRRDLGYVAVELHSAPKIELLDWSPNKWRMTV